MVRVSVWWPYCSDESVPCRGRFVVRLVNALLSCREFIWSSVGSWSPRCWYAVSFWLLSDFDLLILSSVRAMLFHKHHRICVTIFVVSECVSQCVWLTVSRSCDSCSWFWGSYTSPCRLGFIFFLLLLFCTLFAWFYTIQFCSLATVVVLPQYFSISPVLPYEYTHTDSYHVKI